MCIRDRGLPCWGLSQFTALARIFAQVVFPVPREPQNKYAWDTLPCSTSYRSTSVICFWPQTSSKVCGRYLRYKA